MRVNGRYTMHDEHAEVLSDLIQHGLLLKARKDQIREYVIEELRRRAEEAGYPELAIAALSEVWPENRDDSAPLVRRPIIRKRSLQQQRDKSGNALAAVTDGVANQNRSKAVPFLLRYRRIVCSEFGPKKPKVRLVIIVVSFYAGNLRRSDGGGVYPGLRRLAKDTGIGLSTLKRFLLEAEQTGWIKRTQRYRDGTHERRSSAYEFLIPEVIGLTQGLPIGSTSSRREDDQAQARSAQIETTVGPIRDRGRPAGKPEKSNFLKFDYLKSRSDAAPLTRQAAASGVKEHAALPSNNLRARLSVLH